MFDISNKSCLSQSSDCAVIVYEKIKDLKAVLSDHALSKSLTYLKKSKQLSEDEFSLCSIPNHGSAKSPSQIVLVHASSKGFDSLRHAAGNVARHCKGLAASSVTVTFAGFKSLETSIKEFSEGFVLGSYSHLTYKESAKDDKPSSLSVTFCCDEKSAALKKIATEAQHNAEGQNLARDLANTPPNDLYPGSYVDIVKKHFKGKKNLKIKVYNEKDAKKMGMGSFLSVGQGSEKESFLLYLTLNESKKEQPIILVGKGVTFDSGGISIKPSASMHHMKGDMGGAAAVTGAMHALVENKCKKHVVALIPLAENMPSGSAYRPSDVIRAMNGKTIEIINTDAEGRLILADSLCLAVTKKPKLIIDVATLTGAASVAVGEMASVILGNSQKHIDAMIHNQTFTGERLWQLPLYDEYLEYLKSDTADIMNCVTNRQAGTATAAKFLEQFVDKQPWVHLDIASTMQANSTSGYQVKGMVGVATRTLVHSVESF